MLRWFLWIIGFAIGLSVSSGVAWAQRAIRTQNATILAERVPLKTVKTLSWFTGHERPLTLRKQSSAKSITIRLPPDKRIVRAHLHLLGVNSASLRPHESQLLVSLNGHAVQQIALDGAVPRIDHVLDLPADLFRPGPNELTFSVTQKSNQSCERFDAPQLWTKISPRSMLALTYRAKAAPLSLMQLGNLFGQGFSQGNGGIMILYDSSLARAPDAIMAAAQSVALLSGGHQPVEVLAQPLTSQSLADAGTFAGNVIVLQTLPRQTKLRMSKHGSSKRHATLTLTHNPAGNVILTISATDSAALAHAARLLGLRAFAWPDAPQAVVDLPKAGRRIRRPAVYNRTLKTISFAAAGLPVETETGRNATFKPLTFWNPDWNSHAVLYLHLAYSAGGGPGSVVQAFVNGEMVGSVPLAGAGGAYPNYRLFIPENAMNVGKNRLTLKTVFHVHHSAAGTCGAYGNGRSLGVTIFSDSRLAIIGGSRVVANNLAAIGAGAFPVNLVAVPHPSPPVISAAATFGAKLAQVVHHGGVEMISSMPRRPIPGTVVVGTNRTLPAALLWRTGLFTNHRTIKIAEQSARLRSASAPGSPHMMTARTNQAPDKYVDASAATATTPNKHRGSLAIGNFAGSAIIAISGLGFDENRPLIIITAANGAVLQSGIARLVEAEDWAQLSGKAAVIFPGATVLETVAAPIVPASAPARLGYLASRNPILAILVIWGILLMAVLAIRRLIVLRHRRLYPRVKGLDER